MFPGLSPVFINPQSVQTNVPPAGNDPGWSLAQGPNVRIPNFLGTLEVGTSEKSTSKETSKEDKKKEEKEVKKEEAKDHGDIFHPKRGK